MPTTPALALPYPPPTGVAPDVPYYMQQLAEAVEAKLVPAVKPDHALVRATVNQSLPDATTVTIVYGATLSSSGVTVNLAAGTLTVSKAGLYQCNGAVSYAGGAAGIRYAIITVNGAEELASGIPGGTGGYPTVTVAGLVKLAAGDVVRLIANQSSGGALNTGTPKERTRMSLMRVSD